MKCLPVQADRPQCDLDIPAQKGGVSYQPVHAQLDSVVVQQFPVEGHLPPLPKKHFSTDAAYDFFAPREIHLRPGARATINTAVACHFPRGTWCLLKEHSRLAHQYGIQLLGGVIDGGYCGRIKAIMVNIGHDPVTIPRDAAFCQGILLPSSSHSIVLGRVDVVGDRGATGGVNRIMSENGGRCGPAVAVGRG